MQQRDMGTQTEPDLMDRTIQKRDRIVSFQKKRIQTRIANLQIDPLKIAALYAYFDKMCEVSLKALAEGAHRTWFVAGADPQVARKRWINAMKPRGEITVDAGAVAALRAGKSLLPAGVRAVKGAFGRGEPVAILGPDGAVLGKGLIRYTAAEAKAIAGQHPLDRLAQDLRRASVELLAKRAGAEPAGLMRITGTPAERQDCGDTSPVCSTATSAPRDARSPSAARSGSQRPPLSEGPGSRSSRRRRSSCQNASSVHSSILSVSGTCR